MSRRTDSDLDMTRAPRDRLLSDLNPTSFAIRGRPAGACVQNLASTCEVIQIGALAIRPSFFSCAPNPDFAQSSEMARNWSLKTFTGSLLGFIVH